MRRRIASERAQAARSMFARALRTGAILSMARGTGGFVSVRRHAYKLLAPLLVVGFSPCVALAKGKTDIEIKPGPTKISDEERAIQADPAKGVEHGVILVEELEKDEDLGTDNRIGYHLRAKILSVEGASLGDIEVPFNIMVGDLIEWWGRVLLPDGTVLEMPQDALKEQHISRTDRGPEIRHLKGALPGIVPDSVIDYGYVYRGESGTFSEHRILLQKSWPIRHLSYRWVPYRSWSSAFRIINAEHLPVKVGRDSRSVLVTGDNLPAFRDEPWMPPRPVVEPAVIFYYPARNKDLSDFWNEEARRSEERAQYFLRRDQDRIRKTLDTMSFPAGAGLEVKLVTAYDWLLSNVKNLSRKSPEEIEQEAKAGKSTKREKEKEEDISSAGEALEKRKAYGLQLNYLFMGFARALGADAHVIKVANRTDHYWDEGRFDTGQFDATFIAVSSPETPDDLTVVSPGAGLAYGQVPWWYTGTKGMLATEKGSRPALVPPTPARKSLSDTKAQTTFAEDNTTLHVRWSRRATGQNWYSDRVMMSTMTPEARKKRLEQICGSSSRLEVSRADASGIDDVRKPFELSCEGESSIEIANDVTTYRMAMDGPWVEALPELTSTTRIFPVIFHFPHTDILALDVAAPQGFAPKESPPAVKLEGPIGNYLLSVSRTDAGYHVERTFTLLPLKVEARDYSELRTFLADVRQADRLRLAFERVRGEP